MSLASHDISFAAPKPAPEDGASSELCASRALLLRRMDERSGLLAMLCRRRSMQALAYDGDEECWPHWANEWVPLLESSVSGCWGPD